MSFVLFFFFNDTATTEIYTVLTHSFPTRRSSDLQRRQKQQRKQHKSGDSPHGYDTRCHTASLRSEEHTSELQSLMRISYAVFCLKKKKHNKKTTHHINNHQTEHRIKT